MKQIFLITALAVSCTLSAAEIPKIGLVNFKKAVEDSKFGKHEQETFEMMKKQMESIIGEKEKTFTETAKKMEDDDYKDSLSHEAQEKLENQYRSLGQELAQAQNQYYQALQQANYKILSELAGAVSKASTKIAEDKKFDIVMNDDNMFYHAPSLDITADVVTEMDKAYEQELKDILDKTQKPVEEPKA